jgi:hypothetical protein
MPEFHQRTTQNYLGESARQGVIVLRERWQRVVFLSGLIAAILIPLVLRIWGL